MGSTYTNCNNPDNWSSLYLSLIIEGTQTPNPINPCNAAIEARKLCGAPNANILQANDDFFQLPADPSSNCLGREDVYDLYAACWFCQNTAVPSTTQERYFTTSYREWSANANLESDPDTVNSLFPPSSWVLFYDATNSTFNIDKAVRLSPGNGITVEPPRISTTVSTSPDSGAVATEGASNGAPTSTSTAASELGSGKSTNVGAIAGGVVGGLALVIILVLLFFWFTRRGKEGKKGGVAPSAEFARYQRGPTYEAPRHMPPPLSQQPPVPYAPLGVGPTGTGMGLYGQPGGSMMYDPNVSPPAGELPPVFHPGHYDGPVFEKGPIR